MNKNKKNSVVQQRRKQQRKGLKKGIKKVAKKVMVGIGNEYLGSEATQIARIGINTVARQLKSKPIFLGGCAAKLLEAYINPFGVQQVCIPKPPASPSWKVRVFSRGVGVIGAQGFGFVAVSPSLCNDRAAIYTSHASYNLAFLSAPATDLAWASQGTATTPLALSVPTPFTYSAFQNNATIDNLNPGLEGRICSATLSVQYTGKAVDQQGIMCGYNDPADLNVMGDQHANASSGNGYTMSTLMSLPYTDVEMYKGKFVLPLIPSDDRPDDFTDYAASTAKLCYPYCDEGQTWVDSGNNKVGVPIGVIAFTGTAGGTFYYEYVQHVEYKGTAVPMRSITTTDMDLIGYTVVRDVINKAREMAQATNGKSFQACVRETMKRMNVRMGSGYRTG